MARGSTNKRAICQALGISYKHLNRQSKLEIKDEKLKDEIEIVHKLHPAHGHRRMAVHLKINRKRILRVMRKFEIKTPRRKVRRHYCTQSISSCSFTNLVKNLAVNDANQVWASDTSFIKFQGRFWYLVSIEDIFSREVVGFAFSKHHDSKLVLSALNMVILITTTIPLIFHCDQGTEFMAEAVVNFLQTKGLSQKMLLVMTMFLFK